ncbi:MAG: hypothetical protein PUB63_01575 [Clostridia bacterium]|nr:hypothetical protein [Clostridia bacterium]
MFRSAPMGFHKKDVIDYIEKLVQEKDARVEEAQAALRTQEKEAQQALETARGQIAAERMMTAGRIGELEAQVEALEEARTAWTDEKARLESEKAGLESEKARLESEKARLESEKARLESEKARLESEKAELESEKARLESEKARLESEKAELLERALGAEQAFGQLEEAAEELRARQTADARALESALAERDDLLAENESLRTHNRRLLAQVNEMEQDNAGRLAPDTRPRRSAQELFDAFKSRFIEISRELSSLAQEILEAEEREGVLAEDVEPAVQAAADLQTAAEPAGADPEQAEEAAAPEDEPAPGAEEGKEEAEDGETRIEMADYPAAGQTQTVRPPVRGSHGVREMLERLRSIGDRLL